MKIEPLTQRETEIVRLMAEGHRYESVANQLGISEQTVRRHTANISKRIHTNSAVETVAWYYKRCWVPRDQEGV
jgi:DNA-binding CsgD family transcriptional regulator